MSLADRLDTGDLVDIADHIASGAITAEAVASATLDRAEAAAPLNAFVRIDRDGALASARAADLHRAAGHALGPLHGVPLAHKDMFYRKGRISACGSTIRADVVADATCPLLGRLDAAGAVEIGQLHMAEFAMGPTGHNAHLGRCRNPWLGEAITGGSSSGSGAAVGARVVAGALGSDTGGSVRLPAAFCGVVGLKPTHGRLPQSAMMPLSESLDTAGPLARSSRAVARLMGVLCGDEDFEAALSRDLTGLTIGIVDSATLDRAEACDPLILAALAGAAQVLADLGARTVAVSLPDLDHAAAMAALVWAPEAASLHLDHLRDRPQDLGPQLRNRLLHGLALPATHYVRARRQRSVDLAAMLRGPFARCDVLALPVSRTLTPLASDVDADAGPAMDRVVGGLSALTRPFSYLGLPALATPMGFDTRGLPFGLQLVGRPRAEAALLRIGHAYEGATGWLRRPLPTA